MSPQIEAMIRDSNRLAALHDLGLLDSEVEPAFERLTRLATKLLRVPTVLVSLVDRDRQFFKSCVGLPEPWSSQRQTPLSHSFCQYAVVMGEPFIVEDARIHPLVQDNLAIKDLNVVAYAGIPLVTSDGFAIGTFCAIDSVARVWSKEEIDTLRDLTSMVITEIELRGKIAERQRMARERELLLERAQDARAHAERAQSRLALLAEASSIIASSLAYETTLPKLAGLLSCALADHCEIYLLTPDQQLQAISEEGKQHLTSALLPVVIAAQPFDSRWAEQPMVQVLRTQTSLFLPGLIQAQLAQLYSDIEELHQLPVPCPTALIVVPISSGHEQYGLLLLAAAGRDPGWSAADLALAEDIGRRIAMAIANAQLYRASLEAVRTRDDVLAVVTHDLRNPMQVTQIYAGVLRQYARQIGLSDAVINDAVAQIDGASEKMSKLLGELADVAQLQAGQTIELACTSVDLVAIAQAVVDQHRTHVHRHVLTVEVATPELVCFADEARIERVLTNLLNNAIKYSPDGGDIVVTLAREDREQDAWLTLQVQDHGLGIPALDLPRIFEPFFRAGNVPHTLRGMGLGLTSVHQIVKQHRGNITVVSTEGGGTTFTVYLPDSHRAG